MKSSKQSQWRIPLLSLVIALLGLVVGFILTRNGMSTFDSLDHLEQSRFQINAFLHLKPHHRIDVMAWYGPLWESTLGFFSEVIFPSLHDPTWVRHSVNFTLYPLTLWFTFLMLRRLGYSLSTGFLAIALLVGCIRLGGHAVLNTKDFPLACAYLLVSLKLWEVLKSYPKRIAAGKFGIRALLAGALLTLLPYFVRPPAIVHFLVWWASLWLITVSVRKPKAWQGWVFITLGPFLACLFWVYVLWPTVWTGIFHRWFHSFGTFSHFGWIGYTRAFGIDLLSDHLPFWYAPSWIPVILHPLALALMLIGWGLLVFGKKQKPPKPATPLEMPVMGRNLRISMQLWLLFFSVFPVVMIVLRHSVLYDEERHILFIVPPLLIIGALGLDRWNARWKVTASLILIGVSLNSYVHWGRYSYIYKSPVIGDVSGARFNGDYWGVCTALAARAMADLVPSGATVVSHLPPGPFGLEYVRQFHSRGLPHRELKTFNFLEDGPKKAAYFLAFERGGSLKPYYDDVAAGKGQLLWQTLMPTGEPACLLVHYD